MPLVGATGRYLRERDARDERAIESRLYNSWDRPAFVVDGSTPVVPLHFSRSLPPPIFVRSPCDSNPRSISMLTDQQISPRKLPNFSSLRQESRFRKSFLKRLVTSAGRLCPPSGVCLLNKLMRCNFVPLCADGLLRVSFCVCASVNSDKNSSLLAFPLIIFSYIVHSFSLSSRLPLIFRRRPS